MPKRLRRDPKIDVLRETGAFNPRPEAVKDALFLENDFFDARDLVQIRYEMLRRVEADGHSVAATAEAFGVSRPTFYEARSAVQQHGLSGLIPKKRGPRGAHKLDEKVLAFVIQLRAENESLRTSALAQKVQQRFGITVHPRSIERALMRKEKKRP